MPPKRQGTKAHQNIIIIILSLVKFGVFVILWQYLTFRSGLN